MPFAALAIDLDGTLLTSDERVSVRNLAAIASARAAGYEIIIATARWHHIARQVASEIARGDRPLTGPAVACSGAQVFRLGDDAQLVDLRLPAEFAVDLYRICDAQRCVVWSALDDEVLVKLEGENHSLPAGLRAVRRLSGEADEISPRMLLVQGTEACEQVSAELESKWTGRARFVESFSSRGKRILTITADGADKGSALTACCADLAIQPSDVVAFGDAENDVAMFALAGGSFAMGQAKDAVKSAATGVTASNNDDGVAVAIEALLEYGDDAFRRQLS